MNIKKIIPSTVLVFLFFMTTLSAHAAAPAGGISVTTSLRAKKAVVVYFKNLNRASSVSYMLSYDSKQGPQGALGTIPTKGKFSLTRELLFGTCSNKVCRYDTGIKNCVLEITAKLKNGKKEVKRIKLRV